MAFSTTWSGKVLLTTIACLSLASCGGGGAERAGEAVYRGESAAARTAAHGSGLSQSGHIHARLARLEGEVAGLKNDFSQLAMTYNGLMTTNERIDTLLTSMEERQRAEAAGKAKAVKAPVKPAAKPAVEKAAPKTRAVVGVRLGEHEDKTRLVIDGTALGKIQTDLDNAEKLLIVTVPVSEWRAKTQVSGLGSPLVAGWTVQDGSGGSKTLAVQLKKPVRLLGTSRIEAEGNRPARYVIDLGAAP